MKLAINAPRPHRFSGNEPRSKERCDSLSYLLQLLRHFHPFVVYATTSGMLLTFTTLSHRRILLQTFTLLLSHATSQFVAHRERLKQKSDRKLPVVKPLHTRIQPHETQLQCRAFYPVIVCVYIYTLLMI